METIHTILRSNVGNRYLLYVNESLDKSMNIHSWDRESVKKVITLASVMNSYVEGTASFLKICGQTVRNNLKQQNPDNVLEYNESIIKAMKDMGAFKKPVIVAIDWHDIMYYGDPKAERG